MRYRLIPLILAGAFTPGLAGAGTRTTTPPLMTTSALQAVCLAQNITSAPVDLDVAIVNAAGATVAETSCQKAVGSCRADLRATTGVVYCVVDVGQLKQAALVTLMLVDQDGVVRISTEAHFED